MERIPDDELIGAYLDNELSSEERARAERLLVERADLRRLLEELRSLREGLRSLPAYQAGDDFGAAVLRRAEKELLRDRSQTDGAATDGAPLDGAPFDGAVAGVSAAHPAATPPASSLSAPSRPPVPPAVASAPSASPEADTPVMPASVVGSSESLAAREKPAEDITRASPPARGPVDGFTRWRRPVVWSIMAVAAALLLMFVPPRNTSPHMAVAPRDGADDLSARRKSAADGSSHDARKGLGTDSKAVDGDRLARDRFGSDKKQVSPLGDVEEKQAGPAPDHVAAVPSPGQSAAGQSAAGQSAAGRPAGGAAMSGTPAGRGASPRGNAVTKSGDEPRGVTPGNGLGETLQDPSRSATNIAGMPGPNQNGSGQTAASGGMPAKASLGIADSLPDAASALNGEIARLDLNRGLELAEKGRNAVGGDQVMIVTCYVRPGGDRVFKTSLARNQVAENLEPESLAAGNVAAGNVTTGNGPGGYGMISPPLSTQPSALPQPSNGPVAATAAKGSDNRSVPTGNPAVPVLAKKEEANEAGKRVTAETHLRYAPARHDELYYVVAQVDQLEGVLHDLYSDHQNVLSVRVEPAPTVKNQSAWNQYSRGRSARSNAAEDAYRLAGSKPSVPAAAAPSPTESDVAATPNSAMKADGPPAAAAKPAADSAKPVAAAKPAAVAAFGAAAATAEAKPSASPAPAPAMTQPVAPPSEAKSALAGTPPGSSPSPAGERRAEPEQIAGRAAPSVSAGEAASAPVAQTYEFRGESIPQSRAQNVRLEDLARYRSEPPVGFGAPSTPAAGEPRRQLDRESTRKLTEAAPGSVASKDESAKAEGLTSSAGRSSAEEQSVRQGKMAATADAPLGGAGGGAGFGGGTRPGEDSLSPQPPTIVGAPALPAAAGSSSANTAASQRPASRPSIAQFPAGPPSAPATPAPTLSPAPPAAAVAPATPPAIVSKAQAPADAPMAKVPAASGPPAATFGNGQISLSDRTAAADAVGLAVGNPTQQQARQVPRGMPAGQPTEPRGYLQAGALGSGVAPGLAGVPPEVIDALRRSNGRQEALFIFRVADPGEAEAAFGDAADVVKESPPAAAAPSIAPPPTKQAAESAPASSQPFKKGG